MPFAPFYRAIALFGAIAPSILMAANYQAIVTHQDGIEVVRLSDIPNQVEVSVVPGIGNMGYSMKIKGHEILYLPTRSLSELREHPGLGGIPFLAPWANRIDGLAYWANGKQYRINPDLGTIRLDPNQLPIHGMLAFSPLWKIVEAKADGQSPHYTARLEFSRYPEMMAQFPFAHTIEMTYRLRDGVLNVETALLNQSAAPMPVAIGFHPYLQLDDAPRDEWTAHLPAREHLVLNDKLTPTGERTPMELADPFPLKGNKLDDGFIGLVRDNSRHADFWVKGRSQQITLSYGPRYMVAVAYAPPGKSFICFEPMSAITNGFNLSHEGKWDGLQSVPPGGEWRESFEIQTSGF